MLDFPSNPTAGQIYGSYLYSGGVWMQNGALFTPTAEARNRIVNPAMQISQELGDTGSSAPSTYPVDQWTQYYTSAPLNIGFSRVARRTPRGSPKMLQTGIATPKAALAVGDVVLLYQPIEGTRLADLQWGTAQALPIVVRFTLEAPAGTYGFWMANGAGNRSYVKNFVVAANNVAQEFVLAIPGDTTGTWPIDNTMAMQFGFTYGAGTNYITATTGWQAGTARAVTGITNNVAAANSIFLGDVALYADPQATGVAPPWQMPDEAQELAACQRYYLKSANQIVDTGTAMQSFTLPVPMRVLPTITGGGAGFVVYSGDPMGAGTMAIYQTTRNTIPITYSARM